MFTGDIAMAVDQCLCVAGEIAKAQGWRLCRYVSMLRCLMDATDACNSCGVTLGDVIDKDRSNPVPLSSQFLCVLLASDPEMCASACAG